MSYYNRVKPNGIIEALVIDETTHIDTTKLQVIANWAKKAGVRVTILGDENQRGAEYKAFKVATVDYDCAKGLSFDPNNFKEHFALKFKQEAKNAPMLFVAPITAGYGGSGPTACFQCLELMGFVHGDMDDHPEIFQKKTDIL